MRCLLSVVASFVLMMSASASSENKNNSHGHIIKEVVIKDKWIARSDSLSIDKTPADPAKGSYGLNKVTGEFTHPIATRDAHENIRFDGELDYWDTEQYIKT